MRLPNQVTVVEVGPRDGFQVEQTFIPTDLKIAVIQAMTRAGIRRLEATSFVSPKVVPQMRDAYEVMTGIERVPGATYLALVPNAKGAERAVAAGADVLKIVICTSDTYNLRNVGMPVEESLQSCAEVLGIGRACGKVAEAVIGLAFGCPLEGPVPPERVAELVRRLLEIGYTEISIADSQGLANPLQVRRTMGQLREEFPRVHFSLHFHNTRGLGLANVLAALEEGIDAFDSSIGGLGGSEVVLKGASGNVPTEDLVNMLQEMGIETGIDIEGVMAASRMAQEFLGRTLPSCVLHAGTPAQFYERVREQEIAKQSAR